jgi:hypothetical protein
MMGAIRASETLVNFNVTTRRYIPDDSKLQLPLMLYVLLLIYSHGVDEPELFHNILEFSLLHK